MPEPLNQNFSLDKFIYDFNFNKELCDIYPNEITILGIIITFIIGYLLYTEKSLPLFIFLIFFRSLCDIYDGVIARKCNKTSKIGKILDIGADCFYSLVILSVTFIKISNKYLILKIFIGIIIIITPTSYLQSIINDYGWIDDNKLFTII